MYPYIHTLKIVNKFLSINPIVSVKLYIFEIHKYIIV